jgi:D-alanine-D-alanine ligase
MNYLEIKKEILSNQVIIEDITQDFEIYLIANSCTKTQHKEKRSFKNIAIEFFTDEEMDSIINSLRGLGFYLEVYFDELNLIKKLVTIKNKDKIVVFNFARNGFGVDKKSLIPTFCELYNIAYTGSNAYACAISRHKYHSFQLMNSNGIPTVQTWMYLGNGNWHMNQYPDKDCLLILKPAFESASKGVSKNNILYYDSDDFGKKIDNLFIELNQPIIVQKFISGFEVQVPIIQYENLLALPPMGIMIDGEYNLKESIISEDISFSYKYNYYDFGRKVNESIISELQDYARKTFFLLELTNYGRVDFRIDEKGSFYVFDVSTMPYIIIHSAFCSSFKLLGLTQQDIFKSIFASVIKNKLCRPEM